MGRATLHLELGFVFPFDLKDGSGAFGEKILCLDFYFQFVSLLQSLGFHIRNRSVSVFWHAGAHEDA